MILTQFLTEEVGFSKISCRLQNLLTTTSPKPSFVRYVCLWLQKKNRKVAELVTDTVLLEKYI